MEHFDLAICGGGVAGSALAIAMARAGWSVAVLERRMAPLPRLGEMLSPEARMPLTALGVWDAFATDGHSPCFGTRAAWGSAQLGENDFLFNPLGYGWHLDRARFDLMLQAAAEGAGAVVRRGVAVLGASRDSSTWHVTCRSGSVQARFIADATGRARRVLRRLNVESLRYDRLVGWLGYVSMPGEAESTIWIEADSDGWWYSMPLLSQHIALAYMGDAPARPPAQLPAWTKERIGDAAHWSPRSAPADSSVAVSTAGDGWIAVGDAAAAHDPLAGQGIVRALASSLRAAAAISEALHGRGGALALYAEMQARAFGNYLAQRVRYYEAEPRWSNRNFWRLRYATPVAEGALKLCA